jgi:hypothetical protein
MRPGADVQLLLYLVAALGMALAGVGVVATQSRPRLREQLA